MQLVEFGVFRCLDRAGSCLLVGFVNLGLLCMFGDLL